jgi:DNA-binding winged helix-turn-helix (wHTH) protein/Tol biopolymer transport system component
MSLSTNGIYEFDDFSLNAARRRLARANEPVPLTPKAFDVLAYLVANPGRVVAKEELLKAIWPDSFVEEGNLAQYVSTLRRALADKSSLIVTVPGRGYQFAAQVQVIHHDTALTPPGRSVIEVEHLPQAQPGDVFVQRVRERTSIIYEEAPPARLAQPAPVLLLAAPAAPRVRVWRWFAAASLTGALLALAAIVLAHHFGMPLFAQTPLSISTFTQITQDGQSKFIGGTDGSRIYYTLEQQQGMEVVSVSGGAAVPILTALPNPWAGNVSPDGSTLLLISQAGGMGPADSLWSLRLLGGSPPRQLADAITANWSPDGERIACATAAGEIWIMRSDGSEAHPIASPGVYINSLAWSPDGNAIRFSKDGLLWQISVNGSNLHQLLPGWGKTPSQWNGEWAQDGRYYFVTEGQIWSLDERHGIDSGQPASPVQLTFGPTVWDRPIPSPDGRKIYASGRTKRGELVRYDAKSGHFLSFLAGISAEFVSFAPDGKSLAYVTYPEGVLWRASADGSNPTQLTDPPVYPKSLQWSPDGNSILFVDQTPQGLEAIYALPADGSRKPRRLLPLDGNAETDPSWSPDGQKIAFATSPNVGASSSSDLRILDLASGKVRLIPSSEGLLVPHWSPDGRSIAAMTLDTMAMKLFDIASGRWSKLDTGSVAFPAWSHDSRFLYYVKWAGDPAVLRIRIADGKRETVANMKGARYTGVYTLWMGLDPNEAPMLLRDIGTDDIYALTLEGR